MDPFNKKSQFAPKSAFNNLLMTSFIVSFGFCTVILPTLTSRTKDIWASNSYVAYGITRLIFVLDLFLGIGLMLHMLCKRRQYHEAQIIFWPLRCLHCQRVFINQNNPGNCITPFQNACVSSSYNDLSSLQMSSLVDPEGELQEGRTGTLTITKSGQSA